MPTRDSRSEARKIRRALFRLLEPSPNQRKKSKWAEEILLGLARREYEAGYAAGHENQMRFRVRDELDRKGAPCWYCCGCAEMKDCLHTKERCEKCVKRALAGRTARRRG